MAVDEARIMVVDDDKNHTQVLGNYLQKSGFTVSVANSRARLDELLSARQFDVVLLDLHMPDGHGLEIARDIRSSSDQIGIIIISGTEDDIDRVVGLEMGADDFVAKPFNERELLARVRSVLRRVETHATKKDKGQINFGAFRFDLDSHELVDDNGALVHLTSQEHALLRYLILSSNRVLSRDQIMQRISGRDWLYSDRTVDVLVGKLRKKIEADPAKPRFIKTVRGSGYKFSTRNKAA